MPNIIFIQNRQKNGTETRPSNNEFVGKKDIGPDNKNFDIPKELEKMLSKNVIIGRASFTLSNVDFSCPSAFLGKNPSMAKSMARLILT